MNFSPDTPYGLKFSIGGQIGIDVCPDGWDKTFCLQFVDKVIESCKCTKDFHHICVLSLSVWQEKFPVIHFFGDKTSEGGGDYELFIHERTIGYTVKNAADTVRQVEEHFFAAEETAKGCFDSGIFGCT